METRLQKQDQRIKFSWFWAFIIFHSNVTEIKLVYSLLLYLRMHTRLDADENRWIQGIIDYMKNRFGLILFSDSL